MNIWILTVGSSDIQLQTKTNWAKLFRDVRSKLDNRGFSPSDASPSDATEQRFRVPARVLGVVYSQKQAEQHFDDLVFPLIDNFLSKIKDRPIDKIILVLGNQSIFQPAERGSQDHAYWQDTCTLQPLLEKYLKKKLEKSSPDLQFQPLLLKPTSTAEGLDDWNAVLGLVQNEFLLLEFPDDAMIYVSHQAGTPAISSAVQFCSLAKFGDHVRFLVSNEYKPDLTGFVESSSYLLGIKREQAKKLLENHNYAGVERLVGEYLSGDAKVLLSAAIQWNYAKFDDFSHELKKLSNQDLVQVVKERSQHWWWAAYEAAYLAITRLDKQQDEDVAKDTVDALFHSFRAIEGVFAEWGIQYFREHIKIKKDRPYLQTTILDNEQYFIRAKYKMKDGNQDPDNDIAKLKDNLEDLKCRQQDTVFYGFTLYSLFREVRQDWRAKCKSISRFWDSNNGISEKRNKIFHQLRGLTEEELFEIWEVDSFEAWKDRMRKFSNFVSDQTFEYLDKEGSDGQVASLMVKVHQELEKAIAAL